MRCIRPLIAIFIILIITINSCLSYKYMEDRNDRPTFIPCELVGGLFGLPPSSALPCTVIRGVKYISQHYKRGMRMLMKQNRKALSRNRFLNQITNRAKKQVAQSIASKLTSKIF